MVKIKMALCSNRLVSFSLHLTRRDFAFPFISTNAPICAVALQTRRTLDHTAATCVDLHAILDIDQEHTIAMLVLLCTWGVTGGGCTVAATRNHRKQVEPGKCSGLITAWAGLF